MRRKYLAPTGVRTPKPRSPNRFAITAPTLVYCLQLFYDYRGFIVLPPWKLSTVILSMLWSLHNTGPGNNTYPYYGASDMLITVFSVSESAVWNTVQSS